MRKILLFGFLVSCLSGCGQGTIEPVTALPAAKTIVVVPSVPKAFRLATTGLTVFNNYLDIVDESGWGLNQIAYDAVVKGLPAGYQVSEALPDSELVDEQSRLDAADGLGLVANVGDLVKNHVHVAQAPDLYIVLCVSARAYPYSEQPNIGIDVGADEMRGPLAGATTPGLHTFLLLTVVDGKTLKPIYDTPLKTTNDLKGPLSGLLGPSIPPIKSLDGFAWQDKWSDLTQAQQDRMKAETQSLLAQSVEYTVSHMEMASH
jgi:hypothetical protein